MLCDLVDIEMSAATDGTVAVTEFLRSLHPPELQGKIYVVHDGIERPDVNKPGSSASRGSRWDPLRAVLVTSSSLDSLPIVGYPPEWLHVTIVGRYARRWHVLNRFKGARWALSDKTKNADRRAYMRFLLHPRIRRVAWDAANVYRYLLQADIGIIPVDVTGAWRTVVPGIPGWMSKSENRLTLMMSAGLPVIATPIPAYEAVIDPGRNGFLARDRDGWMQALEALRDPDCRTRIGSAARATVHRRFSMEKQANLLVSALESIFNSRGSATRAN
jgi:glycosyltransferase involved in cell wall biosynthesis